MADVVMGKLISKVNYPVSVTYGNKNIIVSPRQVIKNVDKSKLGPLPKGLVFQPDK